MTAKRLTLDGIWDFVHRIDHQSPATGQRSIRVPGPWQAQFGDLRTRGGLGLYSRMFEIPADDGRHVYLHFGAVFHRATIWLNGQRVGGHEGGFLPFSFDVTPYVHEGPNHIEVLAETPSDDLNIYPEGPFAEIPFGKQSWYGPLSGIWQSVFLEWRGADHVECIRVRSAKLSGAVNAEVSFRSLLPRNGWVEIEVIDPFDEIVLHAVFDVSQGDTSLDVCIEVGGVLEWSPDSPRLYRMIAGLRFEETEVDCASESFGFREIEARSGAFFLNGKRLYLRAALDQDYYPEMICSTPSIAFLENQFGLAKELGLNCLRLHIKVPDPRYYEVADRMGLLVWAELPNGGLSTPQSRRRKERLLKGIVDRDGGHPSILIWTIINENWGVDLVHDPEHRDWLKQTFVWLKRYDPTRLVVDNSPLAPSFHIQTDIADYHFYAGIPDHRASWDEFVARLAGDAAWLFSTAGDAVISGKELRLCSEFGNWGLPDPKDLEDAEGREPWWFESGHDWGEGVMYPHGVEQRYQDWSLDRVFGQLAHFVEAAQWQQFRALKYQIESMRRRPELAGYVITEFTDVHWESNGLLDMQRNKRVFHEAFAAINADTVIIPLWERLSYWEGERAKLRIMLANGSKTDVIDATLSIIASETQSVAVSIVKSGEVVELGVVEVEADINESLPSRRVEFVLRGISGEALATNNVNLGVFPRINYEKVCKIGLWTSDENTRDYLRALSYHTDCRLEEAEVVIAFAPDEDLAEYARGGGRVLILPKSSCFLQPFFPHWQNVQVRDREGTIWQGDWASSFSWLRRRGPFAALKGGPLLDETFDRVLPTQIVTGCNLLDFHSRVHAGMVVGWVHRPAALIVERPYGKGHLVVSTFRLFRDPPSSDPTAAQLLYRLIQLSLGWSESSATGAPTV